MRSVLLTALIMTAITPATAQDQALIEAGEQVYEEHCASCHGEKLRSAGAIPDLRDLGAGERARFDKAVLEGRGQMPAWEGVLSTQEFDQVWAFVRRYAR
ncbi:MAG: c-type cytochrome [Xanthobacteraceae bacterium]